MTLGELVVKKRKEKKLNQKQLAALIKKEDGQPISAPYLNDIEHDRRTPTSDHIIQQFSEILGIKLEVLYFVTKRIPPSAYQVPADEEAIVAALHALQRTLQESVKAA